MSYLSDNPDLMMEALAKLVHKAGGYIRLTGDDEPSGPFNILSKYDGINGILELKLDEDAELAEVL